MKLIDLEQNTPEWLAFREDKIGASSAPIIMGVSPWMTPFQLYEQMLGVTPPTQENEAMRRGKALEEEARQKFIQQTGIAVKPAVAVHDKFSWLMASFDGLCEDNRVIVEIKCPGKEDHETALSGKVPEKYYPQLQHQLAVCGYEKAYYFSYNERSSALVTVDRNDDYIVELMKEEMAFLKCLHTFTPPKLTDRDYIIREDVAWRDLANELLALQKQKEVLEDREAAIKAELQVMAQGKNTKGCGIALQKIVRKGNVDYSAIPELKGVDVEKYRKAASEIWQVRRASS